MYARFRGARTLVAVAALLSAAAAAEAQSIAVSSTASYHPGDEGKACPQVTITCAAGYWGTSGIRIVIPPGLGCTWDTSMASGSTLSVTGTAQSGGHIASSPTFSFSNGNKTIIITVASTFGAAQTAIINGLRFASFSSGSGLLRANWDGTDLFNGTNTLTDVNSSTLTILSNPNSVSSGSNQSISPPSPVAANTITIQDGSIPGILNATNLRITIPNGLNMVWNNAVTTVGIVMGGTGNCSTTLLPYEDGDKTAVINVTADFGSFSSVQVSGLQFTGIGIDSGPLPLSVTTNGPTFPGRTGGQGTDNRTKTIFGLPTLSSAGPQVFTKGDPITNAATITVTESTGSPKLGALDGIQIIIPPGLAMTWDTTVTTVAVSGTGQTAGHIAAAPSVTYTNGNKTVVVPVLSGFAAGQTALISGLRFTNFSAQSAANRLQLDIDGDGTGDNIDAQTIAIGAPTISSGGSPPMVFQVGDPPQPANTITITEGTPARITSANGIRIKIPAGFNMQFDTTRVNGGTGIVLGGTGSGHATGTITYPNNQTALVNLSSNFVAGQTLTIAGLIFQNFPAPSTPNFLQLEVNNLGTNCNVDPFFCAVGGAPSISSAANQSFTFNDPSTGAATITITDANGFPTITAANQIQIIIPGGFPMEWNNTIASPPVAFAGTGTGHLAAINRVTYPNVKTCQINLASDFTVGQTLIVSNLQFRNFTAVAAPSNLILQVAPGSTVNDDKTIAIGRPQIAISASQFFGVSDPSTVINTVGILDDATTPRILAANGIKVRINAGLDMTFDTTVQALADGLSFTGTGAAHVTAAATKVTYPNNKTALIALQSDFAAGETLFISGLKGANFNSVTGPFPLALETSNAGTICNSSVQTLSIGARPVLLSVVTADTNGNGSIDHLILTYNKNINPATTSVTAGLGFTVVAPNYTIGAGSCSGAVVTLSLVEKGTADTGITPSIVYDPMVGNLQDLSGLTTNSTGPMVAKDGAAPVAMSIIKTDANGNGHLDSVTIVFSEALAPGQEDAGDWKLIDADGTTDLLQGLVSMVISGNSLTFNLADSSGTTGAPIYQYVPDADLLKIQDSAVPPNLMLTQTNASVPTVVVNQDLSVGPSKVTLDASRSTDPNGQPLTFSWDDTGSPALTGKDTPTPFFLGTTAGTYTYTVTVSNLLVSASKAVHVTILNIPPGADAGSDQTINPGQSPVFVVALASNDANRDPLTFSWTQISGHPVALAGSLGPTPNFVGPTPSAVAPPDNILVFEVTVSDGVNSTKSRTTVRVNAPGNKAPTANAGVDQVVMANTTVQLDGSLSRDPEGAALTYKWTSTTPMNPPAGDVVNPTFLPTLPGLYTFQLTVTDNANLSSFPSTVHVLVQSPGNQAPVASAHRFLPVGEILKGDQVVLDATGSQDPEGGPLTYAWLQTAGPQVILESPSTLRPTFTPVVAATYTFRLIVSDGVNQSAPDFVSLTVKDLSTDVTFTTNLTGGAGVDPSGHAVLPGTFQVNFTTSVPGSTWFFYLEQLAGPAVGITSSTNAGQLAFPPSNLYTITPTVPGVYQFRLASTSFAGIRAYSTFTVVVDQPPVYQVPTAIAAGPLSVVAGQMITLDSSGSSGATRYYWSQLEGPPVALSDNRAASPTATPTAAGQYTFALTVADATSNSTPSFVVVTVTPAPAPVASSGGGNGGCGFLGLEGLLVLPLLWAFAALRNRLSAARN